ncbi:MAG: glycosyltransferase family 2 protein [Glaciihabitans sp.]|nr:glycosyltransferase family 2 protein [Glaciihabitans sp.]
MQPATIVLLVTFIGVVGVGTLFWSSAGIIRAISGALRRVPDGYRPVINKGSVAIVIAAHNEELVIEKTLASAMAQVPCGQIYVASDGSSDATTELAISRGANVLDLNPNRGKAGAIVAAIKYFDLIDRYDVVMLLDADTVLADDYLDSGLPLFDDPEIVAVAGRASTIFSPAPETLIGRILVTYRQRVYIAVQYLLKYGQASRLVNVVSIVPGFASMYRTRVVGSIDIDAPGLSIEDYNMTFEIHAKSLGRIAFNPRAAIAHTQDPDTLHEYSKQVQRWSLGFWQTLLRHGWRARVFFLVTWLSVIELLIACVMLVITPPVALLSEVSGVFVSWGWDSTGSLLAFSTLLPGWVLILGIFVPDIALSMATAVLARNARFLWYAPVFPLLRVLDAVLCLVAFRRALGGSSSGVWQSPQRRAAVPQKDSI